MKVDRDAVSNTVTLEAVLDRVKGDPRHKIAAALQEVVAACHQQQKNGKVNIAISLEPVDGGRIWVGVDVTSKAPTAKTPSTLLFSSEDGRLLTADPNQPTLPGTGE